MSRTGMWICHYTGCRRRRINHPPYCSSPVDSPGHSIDMDYQDCPPLTGNIFCLCNIPPYNHRKYTPGCHRRRHRPVCRSRPLYLMRRNTGKGLTDLPNPPCRNSRLCNIRIYKHRNHRHVHHHRRSHYFACSMHRRWTRRNTGRDSMGLQCHEHRTRH